MTQTTDLPLQSPPTKPKRKGGRRHEGTIFQRADGRWCGSLSAGTRGGKRIRHNVTGSTKSDVLKSLRKLQPAKDEGRLADPSTTTLAEWSAEWIDKSEHLRPQTLDSYRKVMKLVCRYIGHHRLQRLTRKQIREELLDAMETDGKTATRRQTALTILRKCLRDAQDRDHIRENPASARALRPKSAATERAYLTPEQAVRFLELAASDRLAAMYVLAIRCGLRQGELFALKWADINFESATLTISRTLVETQGKVHIGPPKSAKGYRTISLSAACIDALHRHRRLMLSEGHAACEYVFCSPRGALVRRPHFYIASWQPILARAEQAGDQLPDGLCFHSLRHTHATGLLLGGISPRVVQERLGHSSIQITLGTYSHCLPAMDRAAADITDQIFAPQPTAKAERA